uniref:Uncharacterized protein n=1 Tax=viral metagenome TaxID=1070528 RepID=A0A6M3LUL5_9ZZZZ
MNTLPTAVLVEGTGTRLVTEVPTPDGLILVREDCDTCGNDGTVIEGIGDPTFDTDARVPLWMLDERPCPACLGVPILAWYRECDQCGGKGSVMADCPDPPPQPKTGWGSVSCGVLHLKPCPNGCVGVDGRRLVKVRRNP